MAKSLAVSSEAEVNSNWMVVIGPPLQPMKIAAPSPPLSESPFSLKVSVPFTVICAVKRPDVSAWIVAPAAVTGVDRRSLCARARLRGLTAAKSSPFEG
jgi:hypothetical protein